MTRRLAFAALLSGTLLAGCNGWPKAIAYQEAETKPEKYPTYAPAAEAQTIEFEHRRWLIEPSAQAMPGVEMQAVGTAGGAAVFAPKGTATPYQVLYAQDGTKWRRVMPIE